MVKNIGDKLKELLYKNYIEPKVYIEKPADKSQEVVEEKIIITPYPIKCTT